MDAIKQNSLAYASQPDQQSAARVTPGFDTTQYQPCLLENLLSADQFRRSRTCTWSERIVEFIHKVIEVIEVIEVIAVTKITKLTILV